MLPHWRRVWVRVGRGVVRGLDPKENSEEPDQQQGAGGRSVAWQMELSGAKTPQSVLYEELPHIHPHHCSVE